MLLFMCISSSMVSGREDCVEDDGSHVDGCSPSTNHRSASPATQPGSALDRWQMDSVPLLAEIPSHNRPEPSRHPSSAKPKKKNWDLFGYSLVGLLFIYLDNEDVRHEAQEARHVCVCHFHANCIQGFHQPYEPATPSLTKNFDEILVPVHLHDFDLRLHSS